VSQDFRIAQSEVADDVSQVLSDQGQPPGEPPAGLASATAQRLVQARLIESYAALNGLELTRTQVQQGLEQLATENGGREALNNLALQSGIPIGALEDTVRTNLLITAIGEKLNPSGDAQAKGESTRVALSEYSDAIDVEVSPRYGTWDDAQLSIVPGSSVTTPSVGEQATQ
jgi:FKBP-type peptidyl-prolyl cis-trans isomerase (trigger factor)